jgi:hypothetical protein
MKVGLHRDFTWHFLLADVDLLIIGLDLLSGYVHLDCSNNRRLDGVTSLITPDLIAPLSVRSVKVIAGGTAPDSLLEEFPGLTMPAGSHREVQHNTSVTSAAHPAHV